MQNFLKQKYTPISDHKTGYLGKKNLKNSQAAFPYRYAQPTYKGNI